jgi:hypothetical protein
MTCGPNEHGLQYFELLIVLFRQIGHVKVYQRHLHIAIP